MAEQSDERMRTIAQLREEVLNLCELARIQASNARIIREHTERTIDTSGSLVERCNAIVERCRAIEQVVTARR